MIPLTNTNLNVQCARLELLGPGSGGKFSFHCVAKKKKNETLRNNCATSIGLYQYSNVKMKRRVNVRVN